MIITDEDREIARELVAAYERGPEWPGAPIYTRDLSNGERIVAWGSAHAVRVVLRRTDRYAEQVITIAMLRDAWDVGAGIALVREDCARAMDRLTEAQ